MLQQQATSASSHHSIQGSSIGSRWDTLPMPWHMHRAAFGTLVTFPLAQTGEGISECELIQWFVTEGQTVGEFDKLCEVQSDKASIEITSRYSGIIRKLHHGKGDVVKVGATLVDIETNADVAVTADVSTAAAAAAAVPAPAAAPAAVTLTSTTGTAAAAAAAAMPSAAPLSSTTSSAAADSHTAPAGAASAGSGVLSSPAVRSIAREHGIDLATVKGTGEGGRVTKEDVLRHIQALSSTQPLASAAPAAAPLSGAASAAGTPTPPAPGLATAPQHSTPAPAPGAVTRLTIRGYRRAMVKSMTAAAAVPHFHYHDEVCMDGLMAARKALASHTSLHGVKLTLLPIIIKALSVMLASHPTLNASLSSDASELLLHGSHNVGVAMATPSGLVVPVVKGVQGLSVVGVAREIARLQAAAAANKVAPDDLAGATISVSNIGTIGGMYANPLCNGPEAAIVAIGRVRTVPAFAADHKTVIPRAVMGVSWGADHRVVDGAVLAHACNTWKALLETPAVMLLTLK